MITKFEAIGIASCIGIMVLALFVMRLDTTARSLANPESADQVAAVVVTSESDGETARAQAVADAFDIAGNQKSMIIDDITIGTGAGAQKGDTVLVHYIGRLQNGQEFDNSFKRGTPIEFTIGKGEVIQGWEEGILGMKVGGERILVIPPSYAYGNRAVGPIPAKSTLVFAVELIEIVE